MERLLKETIAESTALLSNLSVLAGPLESLGSLLLACWNNRGKVLMAGNGGSMADAMHFAEELSVRFRHNRRALAAMALCDPAALTCAGNDFGFETVFARQVEALGSPGDLLVVFSTSGRSPNILKALRQAEAMGMTTVGFLGSGATDARALCNLALTVPSATTARIQEGHKLLFHTLCQWVEAKL